MTTEDSDPTTSDRNAEEDAAAAEPPPDAELVPAPQRSRPGKRKVWPMILAATLAAAIGLAAFVAVTERDRANDARAEVDSRDEARLVAASFAEAYLSYDYTDVEESQARIAEFASDAWLEDFEATRLQEVDDLFANIESTTVAETTAVYLGDVSDHAATALVVVDVEATSAATGDQTLTDLTFVVDMIRVGDVWRIDEVAPPPQANVGGDPTEPATDTTSSSTTEPD